MAPFSLDMGAKVSRRDYTNLVPGDSATLLEPLTNIPAGAVFVSATLTIKRAVTDLLADPNTVQATITTVASADGVIIVDGTDPTKATLEFSIPSTDTAGMTGTRHYGIQVTMTVGGAVVTREVVTGQLREYRPSRARGHRPSTFRYSLGWDDPPATFDVTIVLGDSSVFDLPVRELNVGDVVVEAKLILKERESDADDDVDNEVLTITPVAGADGQIQNGADATQKNLHFVMSSVRSTAMEAMRVYAVKMTVTRNGANRLSTIARGRVGVLAGVGWSPTPIAPADPVAFATMFNNYGAAEMVALYFYGRNQNIVPDAGSSTGFYCTMWDDCLNPGAGRHWRPRLAGAWGVAKPQGAKASANGLVHDDGLYIPYAVAGAAAQKFTYGDDDVSADDGPIIAGGFTVKDGRWADDTKGLTYAVLARGDGGSLIDAWGNDRVPSQGKARLTSQSLGEHYVNDQESSAARANWYDTDTGRPMHFQITWRQEAVGDGTQSWEFQTDHKDYFNFRQFDRDSDASNDFGVRMKDRDLVLGSPAGPYVPGSVKPVDIYYVAIIRGNPTKVQNKLLRDFSALTAPTVWWDDSGRTISYVGGDSMITQNVQSDVQGAVAETESWPGVTAEPKFWQHCCFEFHRAGQSVGSYQYPIMKYHIGRMDWSLRPAVAGAVVIAMAEFINNGLADVALPDNSAFAEMAKAVDPVRVRCTGYDEIAAGRNFTPAEVANARAMVPASFYAMIPITDAPMYDPAPYAAGTIATEDTQWWLSQHPSRPLQHVTRVGIERARISAALPAPAAGPLHLQRTMWVRVTPGAATDADGTICTLAANGNVFQIVPLPQNAALAANTPAGQAFEYRSTDNAVCTVTAGGLVTRIGPGRCSILIKADAMIGGRLDRGYGGLSMVCP